MDPSPRLIIQPCNASVVVGYSPYGAILATYGDHVCRAFDGLSGNQLTSFPIDDRQMLAQWPSYPLTAHKEHCAINPANNTRLVYHAPTQNTTTASWLHRFTVFEYNGIEPCSIVRDEFSLDFGAVTDGLYLMSMAIDPMRHVAVLLFRHHTMVPVSGAAAGAPLFRELIQGVVLLVSLQHRSVLHSFEVDDVGVSVCVDRRSDILVAKPNKRCVEIFSPRGCYISSTSFTFRTPCSLAYYHKLDTLLIGFLDGAVAVHQMHCASDRGPAEAARTEACSVYSPSQAR